VRPCQASLSPRCSSCRRLSGGRPGVSVRHLLLARRGATYTFPEGGPGDGDGATSSAFDHQGEIPLQYTCDGADHAPPLAWSGIPAGTRSLALIVDDPDAPDPKAPKRVYVHWVLYNIPPDASGLAEAILSANLPAGTREGLNDWGRTGYGGPCPPIGRHRYFHKLYALDKLFRDLGQPTKAQLLAVMEGHVLAQTELIGTYQRRR
jgi:Raf kinase inhibitor-like YbhB/YbcL family protein